MLKELRKAVIRYADQKLEMIDKPIKTCELIFWRRNQAKGIK